MINFNPFNLTGWEAAIASSVWCVGAVLMVYACTAAAIEMTKSICACVKDSVVAWATAKNAK